MRCACVNSLCCPNGDSSMSGNGHKPWMCGHEPHYHIRTIVGPKGFTKAYYLCSTCFDYASLCTTDIVCKDGVLFDWRNDAKTNG